VFFHIASGSVLEECSDIAEQVGIRTYLYHHVPLAEKRKVFFRKHGGETPVVLVRNNHARDAEGRSLKRHLSHSGDKGIFAAVSRKEGVRLYRTSKRIRRKM